MRVFLLSILLALPMLAASVRVYQTNSAGDAVNVIDPATNKVVQSIRDIEVPHGVAFSPDGTRAWITCEAEKNVWVVDTKTGRVIRKIALSPAIRIIWRCRKTASACLSGYGSRLARWMLSIRRRLRTSKAFL